MKATRWTALVVLCVFASSLAVGCGKSKVVRCPVSGTVTVGGEPVEVGSIEFIPEADSTGPVCGGTIANGAYSIDKKGGPTPGNYKVRIVGSKSTGNKVEVPGAPGPIDELIPVIAKKYAVPGGTEIPTATIKAGKNVVDFALDPEDE